MKTGEDGSPGVRKRFAVGRGGRARFPAHRRNGNQVALRYLGPGEMAGYAALAGIASYPGTVVAVEDTRLFAWPASAMQQ